MVDIAESTPGPIAINAATYVGYKLYGFWGSLLVTPGICIPSFAIIIFVIIAAVAFVIKKATKKNAFPILLILTSALLGILLYSF